MLCSVSQSQKLAKFMRVWAISSVTIVLRAQKCYYRTQIRTFVCYFCTWTDFCVPISICPTSEKNPFESHEEVFRFLSSQPMFPPITQCFDMFLFSLSRLDA